jgi:hypothetical protein
VNGSDNAKNDPRVRPRPLDPLRPFSRNEICWCGSGRKYKVCHLIRNLTPPGAPLPPDPEDGVYISPNTVLSPADGTIRRPSHEVTITTQFPTPQAQPTGVTAVALELLGQVGNPQGLADLGRHRFALLDELGLISRDELRNGLSDDQIRWAEDRLVEHFAGLTRDTNATLLALASSTTPRTILQGDSSPSRLIGSTMFWADHYLVPDYSARVAADVDSATIEDWREALDWELLNRPLLESGFLIPVFDDLARAAVANRIDEIVERDLHDEAFVAWVESQVVIEGPSAREVAFAHVIDGYGLEDAFWQLARTQGGGAPTTLNQFEPDRDYGAWLSTVRRQATARLVAELVSSLTVARTLGAQHVTTSPFRARAMQRRRALDENSKIASAAVWADVPWLPEAEPALLAKIASNDERVNDLRRTVARAVRGLDGHEALAGAISEAAHDLRDDSDRLQRTLRRDLNLGILGAGGLSVGAALLGATLSPVVAVAALFSGAGAALPSLGNRLNAREQAAYAFWMARPR